MIDSLKIYRKAHSLLAIWKTMSGSLLLHMNLVQKEVQLWQKTEKMKTEHILQSI